MKVAIFFFLLSAFFIAAAFGFFKDDYAPAETQIRWEAEVGQAEMKLVTCSGEDWTVTAVLLTKGQLCVYGGKQGTIESHP